MLERDLFVEVDHMSGHSMSNQAKYMVCTKFHEAASPIPLFGSINKYLINSDPIWLRIDRGGMGGGKKYRNISFISTRTKVDDCFLYSKRYVI